MKTIWFVDDALHLYVLIECSIILEICIMQQLLEKQMFEKANPSQVIIGNLFSVRCLVFHGVVCFFMFKVPYRVHVCKAMLVILNENTCLVIVDQASRY
jgi:hypothetical protein